MQLQRTRATQDGDGEGEGDCGKRRGEGRGGERGEAVARMRLCAVGDVLLPEGLQPHGGGEGAGADLEPVESTKAPARRTHGEDDRRGRESTLLVVQDGR